MTTKTVLVKGTAPHRRVRPRGYLAAVDNANAREPLGEPQEGKAPLSTALDDPDGDPFFGIADLHQQEDYLSQHTARRHCRHSRATCDKRRGMVSPRGEQVL